MPREFSPSVLLLFFGNASIRVFNKDSLHVVASVCGFRFTIYPDKKDAPKEPKSLAKCWNPKAVLRRELRRQQREKDKADRKKARAAKKAEKKTGIPQKYCPVPNLKENLEMILVLTKKFCSKTRGKITLRINKLHIRVASEDAASTAILYGVVVQLVSYILGYIENAYMAIERQPGDLVVEPNYAASQPSVSVDLVCSAKIWRAILIIIDMMNAYDEEKKKTYRKAALREREQRTKSRFDYKKIITLLTRVRKDHSLWKTNLLSRK